MKLARLCLILAASLMAGAAHASATAFANNPTGNSTDWTNRITSLGGVIDTRINFETHPLGALQPGFYAGLGVNMVLSGSQFTFNEVYDYRNDYSGTVSGYGPNSSGEGVAAESRAFSAYNPNGPWSLTLNFDQAVLGTGLYVIDLFNGQGNRTVTLSAYDGINGTGNLLATASAPSYNYQLYNKLFLGVANDSATPSIHSVVFTNPTPLYGDGIALDDIRVAAVPEPETWAMLLVGLGLVSLKLRRTKSTAIYL
jgi:hypothetical protein